ncbi:MULTISPECIES: NodA family N-acyltransferase [Bradyrhizobium]|uniref:Nodulation protein A n=15 Tax=Bradyrhizobium TaxID=374 RepID=A0A0K2VM46_9BRAD|nr:MULTISPECIES: NodA family N-acyltransferase [Bradyrhizobium]MDA9413989.1 acyltransferase [Bradyrhizobium sp. CCBAU 25360]MDD1523300.1 acyltransferase [Bradyrhizobium sp. WBAH30]MDD1547356.1 acyltransferase [Bradyrhizobium sp. WBAH41]MDD1560994.1 acyltransferase [Bradyrhizobium sp. WBAH23]MDD1568437.1 acyltransferase [Bradyrhizobium sp. WBAH33]
MNIAVSPTAERASARAQVQWSLRWESELRLADHAELAEFFRKSYGPTGAFNAQPFEGSRSWAGARPELRAIGSDARGVAAHIGLLRRFIKVCEVDLLVAELGLYAVRPDLEGLGISHAMRVMYPVLQELGVPFGFGTVRSALEKHMKRLVERQGLATLMHGIRVRSTQPDVYPNLSPTRLEDAIVVVFPLGRSISEWPAGTVIDRNGPEL